MSAPLAASLVQPVVLSLVKGRSGRRVRRTGRVKMNKNLVQPHRLSNIEITNYFNYKPRFKSVSSRNNLPRIKDGALVINLDDKKKVKQHSGFHYLLVEIQLYTLIVMELNIFL